MMAPPSVKVMLPVSGVGVTVAVKVTCRPAGLVPFDDERAVAVAALATACVSGEDVELRWLGSPEYDPMMERDPTAW